MLLIPLAIALAIAIGLWSQQRQMQAQFDGLLSSAQATLQSASDPAAPAVEVRADGLLWVRGDFAVDELNDLLGAAFPTDEADTVGGLVTAELGRLPKPGDSCIIDGTPFRVEVTDFNRVGRVSLVLNDEQQARWQEATA